MPTEWTVNANKPDKTDKYQWHVPANQQQHVESTVAPSNLQIKPKNISLKPTLAPKQSGIQSGQSDWSNTNSPDTAWYVWGQIT